MTDPAHSPPHPHPHPYPHPLLSAEEIEAALVERKHPINPFASRTETCMSDMGE